MRIHKTDVFRITQVELVGKCKLHSHFLQVRQKQVLEQERFRQQQALEEQRYRQQMQQQEEFRRQRKVEQERQQEMAQDNFDRCVNPAFLRKGSFCHG